MSRSDLKFRCGVSARRRLPLKSLTDASAALPAANYLPVCGDTPLKLTSGLRNSKLGGRQRWNVRPHGVEKR